MSLTGTVLTRKQINHSQPVLKKIPSPPQQPIYPTDKVVFHSDIQPQRGARGGNWREKVRDLGDLGVNRQTQKDTEIEGDEGTNEEIKINRELTKCGERLKRVHREPN